MKLDILLMAAHPDDAEMSAGGLILSQVTKGKKVGILNFTRGDLGTRGTPEIRDAEAAEATRILGVCVLENVGFRDGFFINDERHQREIIRIIRQYRPEIVIANAIDDRHHDHPKAAKLAEDACFLAGLRMIETADKQGKPQTAWRPKQVYHYIQDRYITPDFVVDITPFYEQRMQAVRAYKSQFYDLHSPEPNSYISSPEFMLFLEARCLEMGHKIGVTYGEGFTSYRSLGVTDIFNLI